MNWLAVVAAALALLRALVEYLRDRQTIDAATADILLKSNSEARDAIDQANKARAAVRAAAARGSDPLSDDGFRRDD